MDLQVELNKVIDDNTSGSGQLVEKIKDLLGHYANQDNLLDTEALGLALNKAREGLPTFAVVQHFLLQVNRFIESAKGNKVESSSLQKFLKEYTAQWESYQESLFQKVMEIVDFEGKTVFLHSYSSTLCHLFNYLKDNGVSLKAVQTISRPNREGIFQAQFLASLGYHVTLIEDAAMARFLPACDMAFIGADSLHEEFLVNKIGSLPLALVCKKYLKPLYALADERKKVTPAYPDKVVQKLKQDQVTRHPSEILEQPILGVEAINYYFERVPYMNFERVFTSI